MLKEGDEILVKVLEVDRSGKIRLSRKEAHASRRDAAAPAGNGPDHMIYGETV